jgi:putative addiction module component (TIGR02574 family)
MTTSANRVLKDALELTERERAELAARLIASLESAAVEDPDEVRTAWAAEIERRCAELDAGVARATDWDETRRRVEAAIRRT